MRKSFTFGDNPGIDGGQMTAEHVTRMAQASAISNQAVSPKSQETKMKEKSQKSIKHNEIVS